MNLHYFSMHIQGYMPIASPYFCRCKYFSRPAKENAPEIGRIYAVVRPMSCFSFMPFV